MTQVSSEYSDRTLWLAADGVVCTIDQTRLPFACDTLRLSTSAVCAQAIRSMQVRGAPLIGAVAAYGLALALREDASDSGLQRHTERLLATRPTAVNLRWALEKIDAAVRALPEARRAAAAWQKAGEICDLDVRCNRQIGHYALDLLNPLSRPGQPLQLLTHCNAGAIATVAYGTALAPIYLMHEQGLPVHVWVDETRPRNQGASLTAWELQRRGINCTVIADNAGGLLMMQDKIDAVIVGCDRVAANGDVINKIGTYLKALAAKAHDLPFLVACPSSTIDLRAPTGAGVPIEERDPQELTHIHGRSSAGEFTQLQLVADHTRAHNPAFDITPGQLVSHLVTELGVCTASSSGIDSLNLGDN